MATEHENTSAEDQALADEWAAALEETGDVGQDDIDALLAAFDAVRTDAPSVILCDTRIGRGVPMLENREKAHFMRIEEHEWQICRDQLSTGHEGAPTA